MANMEFPLSSFFVALPLEQMAKWQFQALQEELRPFGDCLSFQRPETPHLTLHFWRELMQIEYQPFVDTCTKVAARTVPFTLEINGVDTFGSHGEDRVLFLTVAFSPELATLKKLCPWPNEQPFHPHITLARVKHPQKFNVHKKDIFKAIGTVSIPWKVEMLRSYATINGQNQTPIADFAFAV